MRAEVSIQLLKFSFHIFNCIFLILGLGVLSCSLWILFSSGNLLNVLPTDEVQIVGVGLLLIGGLVLLVSVVGCIGADREKVLLLMMYLGLLIVLVLGQLFVTLLLLINRDKIERSLDETVDHLISQYNPNGTSQNHLLDSVQKHGCKTRISDWLQQNVLTIAVMDFGLILILVLQSFITAHLWRVIGRKTALKGSGFVEDWDHTQLDPTPKEDWLENDGSIDPQHYQPEGPYDNYSYR